MSAVQSPAPARSPVTHQSPADSRGPRPRVLISAYACAPGKGSEPEVGWRWVKAAAELADVVALVRTENVELIRAHEAVHGADPRITWVPVRGPFSMAGRNLRGKLIHLHYLAWQWSALRVARREVARQRIDLVHHVTFVTFLYPSLLWACGRPFVYGPVAGADAVPRALRGVLSPRARFREWIKALRDRVMLLDPLAGLALRRARRVIAVNHDNAACLRRRFRVAPVVRPALCLEQVPPARPRHPAATGPVRLLYVGALFEWKGLMLVLRALERCDHRGLAVRLEVCGDGPDRLRLRAQARSLGVDHLVTWHGHLPREAVMQRYREAHALCFPSLRDSGGFVLLEAMAHGCPVLCLDHGGGGVLPVERSGGQRLAVSDPATVVRRLADAIADLAGGADAGGGGHAAAAAYTHEALTGFLAEIYAPLLPSRAPQPGANPVAPTGWRWAALPAPGG